MKTEWEYLVAPKSDEHAAPGIRRLNVPGGWLYQVESCELWGDWRTVTRIWHSPVFVAERGK